jgi:micrococcal nuclease
MGAKAVKRGLFHIVMLVLLLAGLVACNGDPVLPPTETPDRTEAQVVDVVDGDTIKVSISGRLYRVRYIGIDAPETRHPEKPVEWMGPEASAANERLVGDKTVYLEKDVSETDQYGRLLRYVYLADGTFVNAALVRQGYAVASSYPPDLKHQDVLRQAEREAREAGRGLWGTAPSPTSPVSAQPEVLPSLQFMVFIAVVYRSPQIAPGDPNGHIEIRNGGSAAVNLDGLPLGAGAEGSDLRSPDLHLAPDQPARVYAADVRPGCCSLGNEQALWSPGGDGGFLFDETGTPVSRCCNEQTPDS